MGVSVVAGSMEGLVSHCGVSGIDSLKNVGASIGVGGISGSERAWRKGVGGVGKRVGSAGAVEGVLDLGPSGA